MAKPADQGRPDVVVVGAGVSGLTTAVCLAEYGFTVRVDSERPPAATSSAAAGAAWDPCLVESGPAARGGPPARPSSSSPSSRLVPPQGAPRPQNDEEHLLE